MVVDADQDHVLESHARVLSQAPNAPRVVNQSGYWSHRLEGAVTPRVHGRGIERLVVADASVMPEMPSVNTNLPTIKVAERLAAWLRED